MSINGFILHTIIKRTERLVDNDILNGFFKKTSPNEDHFNATNVLNMKICYYRVFKVD